MPVPPLPDVLARLDGGRHVERVRFLALLGRDHAGDPALGPLLDGIAAEGDQLHVLALVAAVAAGDRPRLRAAAAHPSPRVRRFALAHTRPEDLPTDAVRATLLDASAEDRRRVRRHLRAHGRADVSDAVIDDVRRARGDREAADLLVACSPATAARLLPELVHAVRNLAALARRHPGPVLDGLADALAGLPPGRRDASWARYRTAVAPLARHEPDRVLGLIEELGPRSGLPAGIAPALGWLTRIRPARVAALVADPEQMRQDRYQVRPAVARNARALAHDDRVAIARALRDHERSLFGFLRRFAPAERAPVLADALADVDTSTRVWAPTSLDVLPHAVRHAEARRILGLRAVRDDEEQRLRFTALLPFAEALPVLEAQLARSSAEARGLAHALVVAAARRDRSAGALAEALRVGRRLRNEQDPVRRIAVGTLATVPPSLVADEHLDDLRALVDTVVTARDTSSSTRHELVRLAGRLLGHAAGDVGSARFRFALRALDDLAGPSGTMTLPRLDHLLPAGAEVPLVDTLMPRLHAAAAVGRHHLTFALAAALGRRAWGHAGLQDLLARATWAADDADVRRAVLLWLADPSTRSERVGHLVAADESTVTLPVVRAILDRSRQDLLDLLVGERPLRGRFLKGDARSVTVMTIHGDRWLPRQCAAYADGLLALIASPGTPGNRRAAAVGALARVPGVGLPALRPLLASDDVVVQEAALAGLARTDRPGDALADLLAHSGGERARVAAYAAGRAARFVPRAALLGPLTAVLDGDDAKVTARKEAARLLGLHRPAGALELLVTVAGRDATHRDVRIAAVRALRDRLDDERVWRLHERLAAGSGDEAQALLDVDPLDLPPHHRERYAALVVGVAGSDDQEAASTALGRLVGWVPWAPAAAPAAVTAIIGDLDAVAVWHPALFALGRMLADGVAWDEARGLVATLASRDDGPSHDADAERDRPSDQRLEAVVRVAASLPTSARAASRPRLHALADALSAGRPPFHPLAARLRGAAVDWRDAGDDLVAIARSLDDHPLLVPGLLDDLQGALDLDESAWEPDDLGPAADRLAAAGTVATGALAVRLVAVAGRRARWPAPWRDRLRSLRSHPHPDVATQATTTRTAPE